MYIVYSKVYGVLIVKCMVCSIYTLMYSKNKTKFRLIAHTKVPRIREREDLPHL